MLFSAPEFFAFFAIYLLLHLTIPARHRLLLVIVASTVFYGWWNWSWVWLPHALMLLAYSGVLWMERAAGEPDRKRRMVMLIVALLLPLAVVKYANFVWNDVVGPLAMAIGGQATPVKVIDVPLPLGISFVTFTLIAYVVDVFRRTYPVERRAGLLSGLVLFFPHLIAGPILRPHELMPQLAHPRNARRRLALRMLTGLGIFSLGLFKKLVLADQFAPVVDRVYAGEGSLTVVDYLLAIYGFSLQIYCDFSGYTDMAIGAAIMIGVRLPTNFRQPYLSVSIVEFWRRWHITLSTWLRDYLYIPLGGNRDGRWRQIVNLMITMLLGGLWHGASWAFVLWGALHGAAIALVHALRWSPIGAALAVVPRWIWLLVTFHFVTWVWVPFRAGAAPDTVATMQRVAFGPFTAPLGDWTRVLSENLWLLLLFAIFVVMHRWDDHRAVRRAVRRLPAAVLWPFLGLIWALAITVSQGSSKKFVYFDF
jgi:alginate O-acetyltransferase complex protein AlgI